MNTKSLRGFQASMKIARFICVLLLIINIISLAFSFISISLLIIIDMYVEGGRELLSTAVEPINRIFNLLYGMEYNELFFVYAIVIFTFIVCIGKIILLARSNIFFSKEIKVGTPFTFDCVKRLKRLGILYMVISVILGLFEIGAIDFFNAVVVSAVAKERVFILLSGSSAVLGIHLMAVTTTFIFGIIMLVASLVFKHGAEISSAE